MELYRNINKLKEDKKNYTKSYINKIKKFKDIYLWGISESCDEAINFFNKNRQITNMKLPNFFFNYILTTYKCF